MLLVGFSLNLVSLSLKYVVLVQAQEQAREQARTFSLNLVSLSLKYVVLVLVPVLSVLCHPYEDVRSSRALKASTPMIGCANMQVLDYRWAKVWTGMFNRSCRNTLRRRCFSVVFDGGHHLILAGSQ